MICCECPANRLFLQLRDVLAPAVWMETDFKLGADDVNLAAGQNKQIMCKDAGADGRLEVLPPLGEAT